MGLYTRIGKRALDVTGAGLMAVVTAPVMGAIAVALWRTQGRPILFTQQRVGRDDRDFTIYKFRTMIRGASSQGAGLWFERNDPRITPLGKWLRASSLDELPQLWNVIRGDTLRRSQMIEMDQRYVRDITLSGDLSLLLRTVPVVLFRHGFDAENESEQWVEDVPPDGYPA